MKWNPKVSRGAIGAIAAMVCALTITACGSSGASGGGDTAASGTLQGDGKLLVFFAQSDQIAYNKLQNQGVKEEAERLGFKVQMVISPQIDQSLQDGLVRQFVASGAKPAAILWYPADVAASVNSVRQLAKIAPVIQLNRYPISEVQEYVTASVAVDSKKLGSLISQELEGLRDKLKAEGVQLKNPDGNLLRIYGPPTSQTAIDRLEGFNAESSDEPFNLLHQESGLYVAAQPTYLAASPLIPKYKAELDFVHTYGTDASVGVAQALEENGLTLNKDVWMIADNCNGGYGALTDKQIIATAIQSPLAEGTLAVATAAQYLATRETVDGEYQYEASEELPDFPVEPPHKVNYYPLPLVKTAAELEGTTLWGHTGQEMCS